MTDIETKSTLTYPVMEHFYTLQGEGAYAGHAAYFIRLGGCDVGCVWCDVKDSWPAEMHPQMTVDNIVAAALKFPGRIAVITGGEPSLYDLTPLTTALHEAGFRTHIETSASSALIGDFDWVTLSPKKFKRPLPENIHLANELKIIIFNKHDFNWAEEFEKLVPDNCTLLLQPEWEKASQILPTIIDYIKLHPKWHMSLQTHKYLNIP